MLTISQVAQETKLTETDILLVVGEKDHYSAQDVEIINTVSQLQQEMKLGGIRETLDYIQGQTEELPLAALLTKTIDGVLPNYVGSLQKIYQTLDANCSMVTTAYAKRMHQRMMMMETETMQKLIHLVKTLPHTEAPNQQVLKEALWRSCFRKHIPELPKASNQLNGNGTNSSY